MKLLMYIFRNVKRNLLRTSLTVLSVGFSLTLMTLVYGYLAAQAAWEKQAVPHHRIVVMNKQGFSGRLPIAYVETVRSIDGVINAVPYSWFGGNYQEKQMAFAQFATDPDAAFDVWSELKIDPDQLSTWQGDRQGCVCDRRLAERQNWQIGERIPLQGTFYPVDLDLTLIGMFDAPQYTDSLWFHWRYLDEELKKVAAEVSGNSGTIFARCNSGGVMPEICESIDDRYASSENPTRTQSEAAFAQMFSQMLGNVQAYVRIISFAVIFALSLVAGNTMAMSMRERTTEVAVLKALGFTKTRILAMVLGESTMIALMGAVFGICAGGACLQMLHNVMAQMFPLSFFELIGVWLLGLIAIAVGIGLVSGIVPAIRAARLSVVDGLRRVI